MKGSRQRMHADWEVLSVLQDNGRETVSERLVDQCRLLYSSLYASCVHSSWSKHDDCGVNCGRQNLKTAMLLQPIVRGMELSRLLEAERIRPL
jgi:hypothetical protein